MADVITKDGVHDVRGYVCDLCGELCDPDTQQMNALDCTFPQCPKNCSVYHQDCLEKYLKSIRLEKNRKTGFKCPRGYGKASKHDPCPGKINKSHPIHTRAEGKKEKKKMPVVLLEKVKPTPQAKQAAAAALAKEKERKQAEKEAARAAALKGNLERTPAKKAAAIPASAALAAAAAAARAELKLKNGPAQILPRVAAGKVTQKEQQTLEEFEARNGGPRNGGRTEAPALNAWATAGARANPASTLDLNSTTAFPAPQPSRAAAGDLAPAPAVMSLSAWLPSSLATGPRAGRGERNADAGPSTPLVGGDMEEPPLSRAQRKNLRRAADRKAQQRVAKDAEVAADGTDAGSEAASDGRVGGSGDGGESDGSPPSDPRPAPQAPAPAAVAPPPTAMTLPDSLEDALIAVLQRSRARFLVEKLQEMGFAHWQARAAIAVHGSDLLSGFAFLLEGHVQSEEAGHALMTNVMYPPHLDIQPQLQTLLDTQTNHGLPWDALATAVVEFRGDIEAAVATMFDRMDQNGGPPPRAPGGLNGQISPLAQLIALHALPKPVAAPLRGDSNYRAPAHGGAYAPQLQLQPPPPAYGAAARGNGYNPLLGLGGGLAGFGDVASGVGWGVPRPPAAVGMHMHMPPPPPVHGDVTHRPNGSAEAPVGSWSVDSTAPFGALPLGLHSHPLQSEGSFSTQGSQTSLSRHNSGGLPAPSPPSTCPPWAQTAAPSNSLSLQVGGGAHAAHVPFSSPLQTQAAVDAMFAHPQAFADIASSPFGLTSGSHTQGRDASVPLFARVAMNSSQSETGSANRDATKPLYARGTQPQPADPPRPPGYGGTGGAALWGGAGGLSSWSYAPPAVPVADDSAVRDDLESLMEQLLEGGAG